MIRREFNLVIRVPQQDYIDTGIKLVQNDQDVYILNLRITDGITDIDYNQVDHATITFEKRDGNVVQGNLVPADTGYTYKLGTNEIACPGKVTASIQLFGEDGGRLTTARFQFEVVADLITPGAVQSESRFPILQQLVADVEQLKQDIVDLQIPDNSIMDVKLSDAAGQIKQRFASHMADYTSAHGGTYHKNLLHNWDFRNPVNQRGEDVYTASVEIPAIDRWRLLIIAGGTSTYTVSTRELKVVSGDGWATLTQNIEHPEKYAGKTLNYSAEIESCTSLVQIQFWYQNKSTDPVLGFANISAPASGSPQKLSTSWTVPLDMESTGSIKVVIQVNNGSAILNRAKLEMGNVSTLENDPPADYGEQLMLCKRFFRLWTTEAARTEALKEVGLMRIHNPTLGTIDIGGTTYYYASADL